MDWETLVIYCCVNPDCTTESGYLPEFGWIQFSEDFSQVKYGDEKQIEEQKKRKALEAEREISKEEHEEIKKAQDEIL